VSALNVAETAIAGTQTRERRTVAAIALVIAAQNKTFRRVLLIFKMENNDKLTPVSTFQF
jgi:hypothetical protein